MKLSVGRAGFQVEPTWRCISCDFFLARTCVGFLHASRELYKLGKQMITSADGARDKEKLRDDFCFLKHSSLV